MPGEATYTPVERPLDEVRLAIGDTDCADPFLGDQEIEHFLADDPVPVAAWKAAEAIVAKLAREKDSTFGRQNKACSQLFEHYTRLAKRLRAQAARGAVLVVSGISEAEKDADALDTDLVQPDFEKGQFDHPGVDQGASRRQRLGLE